MNTETKTEGKLIFAVDDEQSIREVYSYALNSAGFKVKCFSCAEELFVALSLEVPDLFILDIMLDGLDGYGILERLKKSPKTEEIPVIMVSAKTDEIDKVRGLNLGADDYISKPFGVLELIARVNAKLRNSQKAASKRLLSYCGIVIDDEKHEITVNDEKLNLTLKQYELLKLLVKNAEKVIKRDDILDAVWGENYGETRTLDIHIGDLRKFLNGSNAEIATVRGVGYVLREIAR